MPLDLGIIAIGRLKGAERELCDRYAGRINGVGRQVGVGGLSLVELTEARDGSADGRRKKEAEALLKKLPGGQMGRRGKAGQTGRAGGTGKAGKPGEGAFVIALDERGESMSSQKFARMIARERDAGRLHMAFVLGGPDGHGAALLQKAQLSLSLSPLTMPHGLARAVLAEQLYRALTILANHPYHRQ